MAPPRQQQSNQSKPNRQSSQQSPNPSSSQHRDRSERSNPQTASQSTTPSISDSTIIMTPTSSVASLPPQTPTSATIASLPSVSHAPLSAAPPPQENVWQQKALSRAAASKKEVQVRAPSHSSGTSGSAARVPELSKVSPPIIGHTNPATTATTSTAMADDRPMSVHNFNSTEIRALLSSEFATDAKTYQSSGGNEPEGRSNRDREKDVIRMLTRGVAGLNKETPAKGG